MQRQPSSQRSQRPALDEMRSQHMAPSQSVASSSRQRSEAESWIEIESRPSSSSLSSAADEIITTGLTVQHDSNLYRHHRRPRGSGHFQIGTGHRVMSNGGNSSQEEYEESESESDRVLSSSNEGLGPSPLRHELRRPDPSEHSEASSETMSERETDDDENATTVNYPRSSGSHFEPRPNAFSHPSDPHILRTTSNTAYPQRRTSTRPSSSRQHSYPQHSPYNVLYPHHQPDHDAALRASLSTLLSAAAAVRGLPKPGASHSTSHTASTRLDPTSLRLVPESVALGTVPEDARTGSSNRPSSSSAASPLSSPSTSPAEKVKRKSNPRSTSPNRRGDAKKQRRISTGPAAIDDIPPTLFTWVLSAGVVVLVSALTFSAGYVMGKEAGKAEVLGSMAGGGVEGRCGREVGGGLRRLRLVGGGVVRAQS